MKTRPCFGLPFVLAAAALTMPLANSSIGNEPATRPNILFLLTDDQQHDTIAALGHPVVKTPHLDRLVARGTVFENAYVAGSHHGAVCMPSRAMLMTGRHFFNLPRSITQTWAVPSRL